MKKHRQTKSFALLFTTAVIIVLLFSFISIYPAISSGDFLVSSSHPLDLSPKKIKYPIVTKDQEIGTTESILNNDPECAISIHYPILGITKIDQQIKSKINSIITAFDHENEEQKSFVPSVTSSLWIDYDSYAVGEHAASIVFHVQRDFSSLVHPDIFTIAMNFDLQTQKQLLLSDVFQGNYLVMLSNLSRAFFSEQELYKSELNTTEFSNGTAAKEQNFSNFALTNDSIIIYFQKYQLFSGNMGLPSAEIPLIFLKDYWKLNMTGALVPVAGLPIEPESIEPIDPPVIDKSRPTIALTFDDGPHGTVTPRILQILKKYNARATFFVLGNRVNSYPEILKQEYEYGNEIGNHSFSHPSLTKLNTKEIAYQVSETDARISNLLFFTPSLLRPPYGALNNTVKTSISKPFVLWSIDTLDWKTRNKNAIANQVIGKVKDGDIILMHDLYSTTADACEMILPKLLEQGFQFVTVSELLKEKEIVPVAGKVYSQAIP